MKRLNTIKNRYKRDKTRLWQISMFWKEWGGGETNLFGQSYPWQLQVALLWLNLPQILLLIKSKIQQNFKHPVPKSIHVFKSLFCCWPMIHFITKP